MTVCTETKMKAIFHYGMEQSLRKIANIYSVGKSTLQRWISGLKSDYKPIRQLATRIRKMRSEMSITLMDIVERHPFVTLQDLKHLLKKHHRVSLSTETIRRALRVLQITRKRSKTTILKSKTYWNHLQEKRSRFLESYRAIDPAHIVAVDETAIHENLYPLYGYAKAGKRLHIPLRQMRSKKHSVVMAMSSVQIEHVEHLEGSYNGKQFLSFLERLVARLAPRASEYTILMDHVAFHKTRPVQQLIRNAGHRLLFTPPYSPDTNPIEHVFSLVKHHVRRDTGKPLRVILWCLRSFHVPEDSLLRMIRRSQRPIEKTIPPELWRWIPSSFTLHHHSRGSDG